MTHHTNEDVATVSEGGEDVVHELLVPEPPLGLVVCCVVAVCDQQARPRQSAKDYLQNQNTNLNSWLLDIVIVYTNTQKSSQIALSEEIYAICYNAPIRVSINIDG